MVAMTNIDSVESISPCPRHNRLSKNVHLLALIVVLYYPGAVAANPVQTENAQPGTPGWQISKPALHREIEGYASLTSVNAGGQISFFVNTAESQYRFEMFRLGWYGGVGARQVIAAVTLAGTSQTIPSPDPVTGLAECRWINPYIVTTPATWVSGIYVVKLTGLTSGAQSYIPLVVRNDRRVSAYLFQECVTTYQAYNNWGGKSLYGSNSTGSVPAVKVSFDRPYGLATDLYGYGLGSGDLLRTSAAWEYNMLRFLEKEGYDVAYCTDVDTHENPSQFSYIKAFLVVGHDEYWSWEMRTNTEQARDAGVGLGFFSGNSCYWQIRFETDSNAVADRTIVAYKDNWMSDPYYTSGNPAQTPYITRAWRQNCCKPPENEMMGVMFIPPVPINTNMIIVDPSSFLLANTGLVQGSVLNGLVGVESDGIYSGGPAVVDLAHSPIAANTYSDMTYYLATPGNMVFATGTIQWSWGLDDYNTPNFRSSVLSAPAQQITRNVLARLITVTTNTPPTADSVTPSSGSGSSQVFTLRYSSSSGFGYLANADAMFNTTLGGTNACLVLYDSTARTISMYTDIPGDGGSGSVSVAANGGLSGSLSNAQCTLNGTGSSVTGSGNTLTMALNMTFSSGFTGTKNVYMYTADSGGMNSGWQTRGTWTVSVGSAPTADSVTPNSGSGGNQVFSFRYSSPGGWAFLSNTDAMFNTTLQGTNGCLALYDQQSSGVYLFNDIPGDGAQGPLIVNSNGTFTGNVATPQCTLSGTGSSITGSGNTLTMNLNMTFSGSFNGNQTIFMDAIDKSGLTSDWQNRGSWTVNSILPPTSDSVTPSSGSGSSQSFTFHYSSSNGAGYITNADAMFNTSLGGSNACLALYDKPSSAVYLYTDIPGNGASGALTVAADGSMSGSLSNPQCTLTGAGSSVTGSGNTLTMILNMSFTTSFSGTKTIFMYASDAGGMESGWVSRGTWTVPAVTGGQSLAPISGDLTISGAPVSQTAPQGATATYSLASLWSGALTGTVNYTVSGLPPGISGRGPLAHVSFKPGASADLVTMTVTSLEQTPPGSYPLTISGSISSITRNYTVTLNVQPAAKPDFAILSIPAVSQTVNRGGTATFKVTAYPIAGFTGAVTWKVGGVPVGSNASFDMIPNSNAAVLSIASSQRSNAGIYSLSIMGASGGIVHTRNVILVLK
jgi:hypothetical protein